MFNYGSISEVNQRIEMVIPSHSGRAEPNLSLAFLVGGDFDVQIDFAVLSSSGASALGLITGIPWDPSVGCGHVMDLGGGFGGYGVRFCDGFWGVPSSDTSGRLRMTRSGSTYSGYFWDGAAWQLIHSSPNQPTGDWYIILNSRNDDGSSAVAFDNFYLQADRLTSAIPEPGSFALAGIALGVICTIGRHRHLARNRDR